MIGARKSSSEVDHSLTFEERSKSVLVAPERVKQSPEKEENNSKKAEVDVKVKEEIKEAIDENKDLVNTSQTTEDTIEDGEVRETPIRELSDQKVN